MSCKITQVSQVAPHPANQGTLFVYRRRCDNSASVAISRTLNVLIFNESVSVYMERIAAVFIENTERPCLLFLTFLSQQVGFGEKLIRSVGRKEERNTGGC